MLVLTRKVGETIVIDDEITITVLRVQGKAVSLGIQAPRDRRISRGELLDTEQTEEEALSSTNVG